MMKVLFVNSKVKTYIEKCFVRLLGDLDSIRLVLFPNINISNRTVVLIQTSYCDYDDFDWTLDSYS